MVERLVGEQRTAALSTLAGWHDNGDRDAIEKTFRFRDFTAAWGFMTQVALAAERADHHPEWRNVWNRVDILLTTHSAGGLTAKDIGLAKSIDALAAPLALAPDPD
jgi:4a-hydroxytetrahydrobiopterin dehydratase